MKKATWLAAVLAASCLAAGADEAGDRVRRAVAQGQGSVFLLRALISVEFQGRSGEGKVEVPVMRLDDSGLLVAPNPEAMPGLPPEGVTTKDCQLVNAEGKEAEARVVGRDADFGLIFLRVADKDREVLGKAALPASRPKPADLGDELMVLRRLSVSHPDPVCELTRIISVVQKPRLMYLLSEGVPPGCPAFSGEGELVGLTVFVKEQDPESGRTNAMLVVLPIAQVTEAAKGIQEAPADPPKPGDVPGGKKGE